MIPRVWYLVRDFRGEGVEVGTVIELAGQVKLVDVFDPDGSRVQLAEEIR